MKTYPNFNAAIRAVGEQMRYQAHDVKPGRWQSKDFSKDPASQMKEVLNVSFQVITTEQSDLDYYRRDIQPNLPWADDHFLERVGGVPLNPGVQWANWPWALSADKFRTETGGKFSHTYMERYWPKYATAYYEPKLKEIQRDLNAGIRYDYGDLYDVVHHLLGDPGSRQAYLPVWFPEDTGVVHGERVPCSLGYHWIQRGGHLHTSYYIRSCDFFRHFRDDLYLTFRLTYWLLDQLRNCEDVQDNPPVWGDVKLGLFTFHCVSMHMFINDWNKLYGKTNS